MGIFKRKIKHIWKEKRKEYLRSYTSRSFAGGMIDEYTLLIYAVHYVCIVCGDTKIEELSVHGTPQKVN